MFFESQIKSDSWIVILSQSSNFVSFYTEYQIKNFFFKNCSVRYVIWECGIKSKSLAVILSNSSHFVTFWTKHRIRKLFSKKLFCLVCYLRKSQKRWKLSCHLVTKQSFCHFINQTLNQKTSFTKVANFGMLFEDVA